MYATPESFLSKVAFERKISDVLSALLANAIDHASELEPQTCLLAVLLTLICCSFIIRMISGGCATVMAVF